MKFTDILTNVYYGLAIASVVAVVGKLLYGWFRGDQISKKFIVDMAEHHLPYIYRELRDLNPGAEIHPPISFLNFKEK
jgi:hypothetical protein